MSDGRNSTAQIGEEILFAQEAPGGGTRKGCEPWKILVADDEEEVHMLTRLVFADFTFDGRGLQFISAYSGAETRKLMEQHPDTAVLVLDVVMEDDDAGLSAVRHIRETLGNRFVRIILRTGQPGQAPENEIVRAYDINDYKTKTELTAQKSFTSMTAALRAYRDIRDLDSSRMGLGRIIESSRDMLGLRSSSDFAGGVLAHLNTLLGSVTDLDPSLHSYSFAVRRVDDVLIIVAGRGQYQSSIGMPIEDVLPASVMHNIEAVLADRRTRISSDCYIGCFHNGADEDQVLYYKSYSEFTDLEKNLLEIFGDIVAVGFDNLCLNEEIIDTQRAVIHTLGEVVEIRSQETAEHTLRVGHMAGLMARLAGLSEEEASMLRLAAPLHDVGKIGIPDAVLNKPGALTPVEMELMKTHTTLGYSLLRKSDRPIMKSAAVIAHQHHERWDGRGYPRGRAREDIPLSGRITALVDAFDAMSSRRVYSNALVENEVMEIIERERGNQFDPHLVDLFLDNFDEFREMKPDWLQEASA